MTTDEDGKEDDMCSRGAEHPTWSAFLSELELEGGSEAQARLIQRDSLVDTTDKVLMGDGKGGVGRGEEVRSAELDSMVDTTDMVFMG